MIRNGFLAAFLGATLLVFHTGAAVGGEGPSSLPRYDLDIRLDTGTRLVTVKERVTYIHRHHKPVKELVFNAHARYTVPDSEIGVLAKTLELLRVAPREAMSFGGPPLEVQKITLHSEAIARAGLQEVGFAETPPAELKFHFQEDNPTALVIPLPEEVKHGEAVTVELDFTLKLPAKKGRWGQWAGITMMAQWLPVTAVYDDHKGWQPSPFIPWHQPFFNEAGTYTARITVPGEQKLATTGTFEKVEDLSDGWKKYHIDKVTARDFSIGASGRYVEFTGQADKVKIRCLVPPEHAFYGELMVKAVCEALPIYQKWFGPFPYPQFTIAEGCFGWNGNECGGLVFIDERMCNMPQAACNYVDSLICHELCHQWWYNVIGTNGYCETWMDEGMATYFCHRLMNQRLGKNNPLIIWPKCLSWMPNINREDFRNYGMVGVQARGEACAPVQEMPKFKHLVNLSAMTYDRGSKIVGMIEERLGEDAFFDFLQGVYKKYHFQILRVADFQRELEAYTGRSWEDFFQGWLYSPGLCDWALDKVEINGVKRCCLLGRYRRHGCGEAVQVTVWVKQCGQCNEPTVLGFCMKGGDTCQIRIPVNPEVPILELPECGARIETFPDPSGKGCLARIDLTLPEEPRQISIDPDGVLLDGNPCNNHWKPVFRWRFAPVYTQAEETDVTNAYDRVNLICGPWLFGSAYTDPWYTKSPMAGLRLGAYRTQHFNLGAYLGYRTDDRNFVAGADFLIDHFPHPKMQFGMNVEKALISVDDDQNDCSRAMMYLRYILMYGSSLYLQPFEYVELFGTIQNRCLPFPDLMIPGTQLFDHRTAVGLHYHKNLLTPYWDPEGGISIDTTYQGGMPILGAPKGFQTLEGQVATVKYMPDPFHMLEHPWLCWVKDSRLAFRVYGAAGLPNDGLFFTLGGGNRFRGFDLAQRQGSMLWIGSVEWRVPLVQDMCLDFCDHFVGARNLYAALFYDVGDAFVNNHSQGPVAHAVGLGLRLDVAWLQLIERTMLRLDVAQTINEDTPMQVWVGIQHPF